MALACLNALSQPCIAELRETGDDPFHFVMTLAGECFKGKAPITVLGEMCKSFHGQHRADWSKADLNRLPILLAQQAFEAEVDLDDWLSLGRAFSVMNAVCNLENRRHWQQVHALWSEYPDRPWVRVGQGSGLCDLAKNPRAYNEVLGFYPDVLLYAPRANVVVGTKGVWIEGGCVGSFPAGGAISTRRVAGEHEIVVAGQRIRTAENPNPFLDEIESWLNWYFHQFLRKLPSPPPLADSRHRRWQARRIDCPEGSRPLYPCPGDLGVALR